MAKFSYTYSVQEHFNIKISRTTKIDMIKTLKGYIRNAALPNVRLLRNLVGSCSHK